MNGFQWLAISILSILLLIEIIRIVADRAHWRGPLVRGLVWLAAAVAIQDPMRVHYLAQWLGIGKGVNLVTYTFALAFLASAFYFYAKCVHLQRQITELTRQIALRDAEQGHTDAQPERKAEELEAASRSKV